MEIYEPNDSSKETQRTRRIPPLGEYQYTTSPDSSMPDQSVHDYGPMEPLPELPKRGRRFLKMFIATALFGLGLAGIAIYNISENSVRPNPPTAAVQGITGQEKEEIDENILKALNLRRADHESTLDQLYEQVTNGKDSKSTAVVQQITNLRQKGFIEYNEQAGEYRITDSGLNKLGIKRVDKPSPTETSEQQRSAKEIEEKDDKPQPSETDKNQKAEPQMEAQQSTDEHPAAARAKAPQPIPKAMQLREDQKVGGPAPAASQRKFTDVEMITLMAVNRQSRQATPSKNMEAAFNDIYRNITGSYPDRPALSEFHKIFDNNQNPLLKEGLVTKINGLWKITPAGIRVLNTSEHARSLESKIAKGKAQAQPSQGTTINNGWGSFGRNGRPAIAPPKDNRQGAVQTSTGGWTKFSKFGFNNRPQQPNRRGNPVPAIRGNAPAETYDQYGQLVRKGTQERSKQKQ
jgi:hypothetical protein